MLKQPRELDQFDFQVMLQCRMWALEAAQSAPLTSLLLYCAQSKSKYRPLTPQAWILTGLYYHRAWTCPSGQCPFELDDRALDRSC